MSFVVAIVNVIVIFGLAYWVYKISTSLQKAFWPALSIKLIAGILIGITYRYYYTIGGDTFTMFNHASHLSKMARADFNLYVDFLLHNTSHPYAQPVLETIRDSHTLFFVKLISVINILTNDNYWITSLYFSFLSFLGSWRLVQTLNKYFPDLSVSILFSFLFIPSVIFWSSGVLKESIALAALFYMTHVFVTIWLRGRVSVIEWLMLIVSMAVLWKIKYYYLGIYLPVACTSLVMKFIFIPYLNIKSLFAKAVVWMGVFMLPLFLMSLLQYNFHFSNVFHVVVKNNESFVNISQADRLIQYHNLDATPISFLINAPWALLSGLFRPFPGEVNTLPGWMAATENLILAILILASFKNVKDIFYLKSKFLIFSALAYSVLLCIFLALATPNFGTLLRYRVGFLPFLIFIISCKNPVIDWCTNFIQRTFLRLVR